MIIEKKHRAEIDAIRDLIIHGRWLTFEGISKDLMIDFLDKVEYLPELVLNEKSTTQSFEEYLQMICENFDCMEILVRYKKRCLGEL